MAWLLSRRNRLSFLTANTVAGPLDRPHRSGRAGGDHQDPPATLLLYRRTAHPLGAPPHFASSKALALGKPVQWRPGSIARPAAPFLTAAPATGPPPSPSSTSQSRVSPTRAAHIGQREFLAAFGRFMSGSPHRQRAHNWRHPPEIRLDDPASIPVMSPSSAPTIRSGGLGLTNRKHGFLRMSLLGLGPLLSRPS